MTSPEQVNSAFEDTLEIDGSPTVESNSDNRQNPQLRKGTFCFIKSYVYQ